MKLEQAIVYFEMGYDIARVEWEDGDFVRLIDLPETAIALVKVENGVERNYAFSDEDKQSDKITVFPFYTSNIITHLKINNRLF